ncbi:MAG: hypothetical protein GY751_03880 [Bacteroidetes bacterium]|nr:hypothetical protein [Bacteroidota bacterium]
MISILAIGDQHFNIGNSVITDKLEQEVLKIIQTRNPDYVVLMGDLLCNFSNTNIGPFDRAMRFVKSILTTCKHTDTTIPYLFVLIGNHDRRNNSVYLGDEHFLNPLKLWPNTIVVDDVLTYTLTDRCHKVAANALFAPYVADGRFDEAVHSSVNDCISLCLAHQMFDVSSPTGDPILDHYPLIVSGHVHDYYESDKLIYTGSPYQTTYGESADKSVSILEYNDTDNKWTTTRIKMNITNKKTVSITFDQFAKKKNPKQFKHDIGQLKIKISLMPEQTYQLRCLKLYQELISNGCFIKEVYESGKLINTDNTMIDVNHDNQIDYVSRLKSMLDQSELDTLRLLLDNESL